MTFGDSFGLDCEEKVTFRVTCDWDGDSGAFFDGSRLNDGNTSLDHDLSCALEE